MLLKVYRIERGKPYLYSIKENIFDNYISKIFNNLFNDLKEMVTNSEKKYILIEQYQKNKKAKYIQQNFSKFALLNKVSLKYPRENDFKERQGDLIILKKADIENNEKGVIYITYTESIGKFAALYDIKQLATQYQFVFEPSWWGYQNINIMLFFGIDTNIVVECPYINDYKFLRSLNKNFSPIRTGFGDWVDYKCFKNGSKEEKIYDIVMVGNWSKIKRHKILFKAMKYMNKKPKVVLIGYPSFGRTIKDIIKEAEYYNVKEYVTFFENIKAEEVGKILRKSKVNLLLSSGEGANRGIYEGLFSGNVVVVYKHNKGVNLEQIKNVGFCSDDEELPMVLENAIKKYSNYNTREWALKNTGYENSTKLLNNHLKELAIKSGFNWENDIVYKINRPNVLYADEKDRINLKEEYIRLSAFLIS
jgi:glycosyltransferase involved in cell wall biosynthesis